ncbi:LysR family transcriptional regulator [Pseudonocardia sp. TRM90224]|uniref:LysR family transcriptional regulator n=1 Tax=Pseudonocardia sp. TRM90224 TaxID=2812678 RepID=UPI001E4CFCA9|nr:LysR family transcriptional regulator [Pseudonocardia sp. TRM90224]
MKSATARLTGLDLNLLIVLRELLRERNVTRAAERIGVSQPAASAALGRLRRYFGDDLLVRRGTRYELSALAVQLVEQVEAVCDGVERLLATAGGFDPGSSRREFTIVMSDYAIAVVGQRLAGAVNAEAGQVRLNIVLVREALAATIASTIQAVDCVVSQSTSRFRIPEMRSAPLFTDRWVCVVAGDNRQLGDDVADRDGLVAATWVVPYHDDADFPSVVPVSRQLARLGVRPDVAVRVDSFHAVPYLVASTGHVALMQERLARACARHLPLRVLESPVPLEPLDVRLWWHERHDDDAGHRWFRRLVALAGRDIPHTWDGPDDAAG